LHADITWEIIGAAMEVHNTLGSGFLEKVYEKALLEEFRLRNIAVQSQVKIPIHYKKVVICKHILDLVVEGLVVVELKAVKDLDDVHKAIVGSYLAATRLPVALILNFGKPRLEHQRVVRSEVSAASAPSATK
jgi:GxxExxY protein